MNIIRYNYDKSLYWSEHIECCKTNNWVDDDDDDGDDDGDDDDDDGDDDDEVNVMAINRIRSFIAFVFHIQGFGIFRWGGLLHDYWKEEGHVDQRGRKYLPRWNRTSSLQTPVCGRCAGI